MSVLIAIALKSLLIGGLTLGLLHLMRARSAAERSWVAHVGLLALMVVAFEPLILPTWKVEAPAMLGQAKSPVMALPASEKAEVKPAAMPAAPTVRSTSPQLEPAAASRSRLAIPPLNPLAVLTAAYAVPAAILLFITFLALARLVALQAKAEVLVDGHWLSALARAQRRMGFKHGTALLTSNELASPISWGLMRPVILLNSRAVEATAEAEAIIAHELAHVARLDWIKLLLARVATALFWFNPLVWLLAREAHQLREETADDTVLSANIADTDYAQLLVGVARHECPGLLLGAHGVAPSKSSLARRVARVLDAKLARGPVARQFSMAVLAGALLIVMPLAALTLTPAATAASIAGPASAAVPAVSPPPKTEVVHADLPHIIAQGVSTSVTTAMAAVAPAVERATAVKVAPSVTADAAAASAPTVVVASNGNTVTTYPPDAHGRIKVVARAASGAVAVKFVDHDGEMAMFDAKHGEYHQLIKAQALGLTPEFIAAIRAAAPGLARADVHDIIQMRAVGVSPQYAQALASGFSSVNAEDLVQARAIGLSPAYVDEMRAVGVQGDMDDFIQLRAVGVDPAFAARMKASGTHHLDADTLIELKSLRVPTPPNPPTPPNYHWKKERSRGSSRSSAPDPDLNPDDG